MGWLRELPLLLMAWGGGGAARPMGAARIAVATVVVTAAVVGVRLSTDGGGGGGDTATIWVDANGGTCVDNSSPIAYDDASACTLDAANDTCEAGDVVIVRGGTYGIFEITGSNSRADYCEFQTATGESVEIAYQNAANQTAQFSGSWLSWVGNGNPGSSFTVTGGDSTPGAGTEAVPTVGFNSTSSNLIISDWKAYPGKVWLAGVDILIENSEWGGYDTYPDATVEHDALLGGATTNIPERVTMDNIYIHDVRRTVNDPDLHTDCMHIRGFIDLTIQNSRIQNCPTTGLLIQGATTQENLTIENTYLGPMLDGTVILNLCNGAENMDAVIRYNTIVSGTDVSCVGTLTFKGNIFATADNGCTGTYTYNTFTSGTCGTNASTCSPSFVNSAGLNYHLNSSDTCAKSNGDDADKPATDFDGDTRSTDVDIGADEI